MAINLVALRNTALFFTAHGVLKLIPRDFSIPENYHTSFAMTILSIFQRVLDSTPVEPTGSLWNFVSIPTTFVKYVFVEPAALIMYSLEKLMRGDFESAPQLAEKNVVLIKEHNVDFQQELDKLKPVVQTMNEIIQLAATLDELLIKENSELSTRLKTLQTEIEDITQIDLNRVYEAAEKMAIFIQTTLNNPNFVKKLEANNETLIKVMLQLNQCIERLQKLKEIYQEKLIERSSLLEEAEQIKIQNTKKLNQYAQNKLKSQQIN